MLKQIGSVFLVLHRRVAIALALSLITTLSYAQSIPTTLGWYQIPNTKLRSVCPPDGFGGSGYPFASYCQNVTAAWSGGVFDTKRNSLVIWGGGHNDYYGNEIYALDLDDLTLTRLTDPGLPIANGSCYVTAIAGGTQPNSRHTYNGLAYMSHSDQMFITAGSLASGCGAAPQPADVWLFNFSSNTWVRPSISYVGERPGMGMDHQGYTAVYNAVHQMVYFHDQAHLFRFNPANNTVTQIGQHNSMGYRTNAVLDSKRNLYITIGSDNKAGAGGVIVYDLTTANFAEVGQISAQFRSTTGGSAITSAIYPGLAYDPVQDRIVGWTGGNTVYLLNTDTWVWTTMSYSGGPTSLANGTNGRWRYSPTSNAFVVVNSVDNNAFTLRLTSGSSVAPPNPPTALQVQ